MTIVAINKDLNRECDFNLQATGLKGEMQIWRFDQTHGRIVEVDAGPDPIDGIIKAKLPAASASMFIVK